MKRALILAGGGVAGIAWELGVLRGLQDADPDLDLIARPHLTATVISGLWSLSLPVRPNLP